VSKDLPPNTTLSHYRIVSKIGAGGMGEVYLAQDTKLNRKVALKILPADLAANRDRMRRFVQEAQSAAALNHPNIAHIYEIGESEGTNFIVMEFIEGQTLREKIHKERSELGKLLRFLQHTAEGLARAHAAGIIHRDLKPDNIMITQDGHAKILDFGLAKLVEQSTAPKSESSEVATAVMPHHSVPGTVMGTVGYMSPEQAQGKTKEIDQRSDIFSFGCILFEAATGTKPFAGESVIKSLHMVVYEPAPRIADLNPAAPLELQRIVRRCLAKDPDERYQSIKEVAIELKELRREMAGAALDTTVSPPSRSETTKATEAGVTRSSSSDPTATISTTSSAKYLISRIGTHRRAFASAFVILLVLALGVGIWFFKFRSGPSVDTASIRSIAVLPFQNRSDDADTDYLSDGLAESLIFRLSQLPGLKVSPTSSVMRYKGKDTDLLKIANELGVDTVMTGRFIKRADNLNITVELVDVRNNKSLWGEQFERKMSDLLATQREIAAAITQKLQLKLAGNDKGLVKKYTDSNEAYQLYLKGRFQFARRTKADMERSIETFRQAAALDPNFALAYVGIAESYTSMPSYPYISPKEASPKALAAITKALELDAELPEAHTVAAMIATTDQWDWAKAEREYGRAIELGPDLAITHYRYGWIFLSPLGRHDEAIAEMKRAMELEPLAVQQGSNYAAVLLYARRFDEAVEQARRTYDLDPNHIGAQHWLCHSLNARGLSSEAVLVGEATRRSRQTDAITSLDACLGTAYAKSGKREKALEILAQIEQARKSKYVMSYWVAIIHTALGNKDAAFAELERAFRDRDWFLPRLKVDPFMDPLRSDPRFDEMVKRLNFPP
jgi:serine/threonine protein kinase/tetratricopeptide (TPR) repeat protein